MNNIKALFLSYMLLQMAFMMILPAIGTVIRTQGLQEWHAGLIVSLSGLFWMLSAKFWGQRSDELGRKKVLLPLTLGFFIFYLIWAVFIGYTLQHPLSILIMLSVMLILRCIIAAFFSGINPVMVGYIADHYEPEERASKIAMLGAAAGIAVFLGPFIGGLLAGLDLSFAFYCAAILPLFALMLTYFKVQESDRLVLELSEKTHLKMTDSRIWFEVLVMFLTMNCIFTFNMCIGFFSKDHLNLATQQQSATVGGMTLSAVGLTLIIVQVLISKLKPKRHLFLLGIGILCMALGIILFTLTQGLFFFIFSAVIMGVGGGLILPMINTMTSLAVDAHEQGAASGLISAAQGLSMLVSPLIATLLYHYKNELPYWIAGILLLCSLIFIPKRVNVQNKWLISDQ
ncbi:MFS transporter [Acinetobacter ursingii]|uniref:MFS transporter n=1 Tax=Acinetobacter ursingii TaxID=108980 RepID=UPI0021CD37ED|nr:MFS transporter [Acinetobacter ursingii]MCU4481997.1 MFS transporter [Acinetobacter ursingii]MCU4506427.1 MFS transporter [Acinetobacter ursingii]MCU4570428.1 MFS transporter [Acinetobacter ursingii]